MSSYEAEERSRRLANRQLHQAFTVIALAVLLAFPVVGSGATALAGSRTLPRLTKKESNKRIGKAPKASTVARAGADGWTAPPQPLAQADSSAASDPGVASQVSAGEIAAAISAAAARSESEFAQSLTELAGSELLNTANAQRDYVSAVAGLHSEEARGMALEALLTKVELSEEAAKAILAQASQFRSEERILRILTAFNDGSTSELVRGQLASAYLDVADRLQSGEALSSALKGLLHPTLVAKDITLRALSMVPRIPDDDGKRAVLTEVTDHQGVDFEVEQAFRDAAEGIADISLRDQALDPFPAAVARYKDDCARGFTRTLVKNKRGAGYFVHMVRTGPACNSNSRAALTELAPAPAAPLPTTPAGRQLNLDSELERLKRERMKLRAQSAALQKDAQALRSEFEQRLESLRRDVSEEATAELVE